MKLSAKLLDYVKIIEKFKYPFKLSMVKTPDWSCLIQKKICILFRERTQFLSLSTTNSRSKFRGVSDEMQTIIPAQQLGKIHKILFFFFPNQESTWSRHPGTHLSWNRARSVFQSQINSGKDIWDISVTVREGRPFIIFGRREICKFRWIFMPPGEFIALGFME